MRNENNIDQLFKAKLGGASASGYSASAWASADKALGSHFKMLLIKKVMLIAIPTLIAASAIGIYFIDGNTEEVSNIDSADFIIENESSTNSTENASFVEESIKPKTSSIITETETTLETEIGSKSELKVSSSVSNPSKEIITASTSSKASTPERGSAQANNIENKSNKLVSNESVLDIKKIESNTPNVRSNESNEWLSMLDEEFAIEEETPEVNYQVLIDQYLDDNQDMAQMPIYSLNQLKTSNQVLSINKRAQESPFVKASRKLELQFTGGLLLSNTLKNNSTSKNSNIGFGLYGGALANIHLFSRFYLQTGMILSSRNGLNTFYLDAESGLFIEPKQLLYLDIPLNAGYRIGSRHSVAFGMVFSPLVGAITESSDPTESVFNPETSLTTNGFANFDLAGSLGYSYNLSERLDISATIRFGLFDVTDDGFFNTELIDDRNHQLRVGVNYRLRKR